MENSKRFHLNTTQPSLKVRREDGEIPFPYPHASFSQSLHTSPYYVESGGHSVQTLQTAKRDENKELQSKIARANRKQKLANKKTNSSSSCASPSGYSKNLSKKPYSGYNKGSDQDERVFYTQDNVKLSLLLRKTLTMSDVGFHKRILLPKREVEEKLSGLATKEGVDIVMREVSSNTEWIMKFRFWANQKGNIYLFYQCADFLEKNSLKAGDHLELYHDDQKNLYYAIQKKEKDAVQPSDLQENVHAVQPYEEEDLTLKL